MKVAQSWLVVAAYGSEAAYESAAAYTVVDMVEGVVGFQQEIQQDPVGVAASARRCM